MKQINFRKPEGRLAEPISIVATPFGRVGVATLPKPFTIGNCVGKLLTPCGRQAATYRVFVLLERRTSRVHLAFALKNLVTLTPCGPSWFVYRSAKRTFVLLLSYLRLVSVRWIVVPKGIDPESLAKLVEHRSAFHG